MAKILAAVARFIYKCICAFFSAFYKLFNPSDNEFIDRCAVFAFVSFGTAFLLWALTRLLPNSPSIKETIIFEMEEIKFLWTGQ